VVSPAHNPLSAVGALYPETLARLQSDGRGEGTVHVLFGILLTVGYVWQGRGRGPACSNDKGGGVDNSSRGTGTEDRKYFKQTDIRHYITFLSSSWPFGPMYRLVSTPSCRKGKYTDPKDW
jgi:hypothetical protein